MQAREPYGKNSLSFLDRFGIYLSVSAIKKYLAKTSDLHLLDLGCGYEAKILWALKDRIKSGMGVDFNIHPALKNSANLSFIEDSITAALNQITHRPDVILLNSILEHLENPQETLSACYHLLNPQGIVLINVPTWRGKYFLEMSAFKFGLSPKFEMDDHKMYYDKRDLWPLLVKAGFKPSNLKLKYHKFGLNLFGVAYK